jgi:hypothetical protein
MRKSIAHFSEEGIRQSILVFLALLILVAIIFSSCEKEVCLDCAANNAPQPPAIIDTAKVNHAPVANAGSDQVINLPANIAVLDGSRSVDPDNNVTSYLWTKISGPSSFNISDKNTIKTQAENLEEGVYQFELKLTDASGLSDKDTVQFVVLKRRAACTACRITFVSGRDGNSEIYSCKTDGSDVRRLTNNQAWDEEPVWSPDGTRIAFVSDRTGHKELYTMNADGSNVVRRTFVGTDCLNPTWSPDGSKIAYSTSSGGSSNIWTVGSVDGAPSLLFEKPGYDAQPSWSPDGHRIALVSDWMAYDFVYDIYIISADGTGFTPITADNIFDHRDFLYPSWSPDATKLAINIIKADDYAQIGVMNADGTNRIIVASQAVPWTKTSWSADGTRIVYTSQTESTFDVSWASADNSEHGTTVTNGWNADWQH